LCLWRWFRVSFSVCISFIFCDVRYMKTTPRVDRPPAFPQPKYKVFQEILFVALSILLWSRGSSVSIVSDYGLDDRAIGVRSPAGTKDFSYNLCVQTGSEAHPAYCTMGTGCPFTGANRGRGVTLTSHPHLVSRSGMSSSYTSSPPKRLRGVLCFIYATYH
jgi:hypothetical protein